MLKNVVPSIEAYGPAYSNWAMLELNHVFPFYEVVVCGEKTMSKFSELEHYYIPNKLICGLVKQTPVNTLPLTEGKYVAGKTMIYVCVNKTCRLPHEEVLQAVEEMK
jgi:uncharacterized protein YyaL (SSP411 family)